MGEIEKAKDLKINSPDHMIIINSLVAIAMYLNVNYG
jgi:hypothetical protein